MTSRFAVENELQVFDRPIRCQCGQVLALEKPDGAIRPVGEWWLTIRGEAMTICPSCHRKAKLPIRRAA